MEYLSSVFIKILFNIIYINKIQNGLKQKNAKIFLLEENTDKNIDDIFKQIPSTCYLDLFRSVTSDSYEGKLFLKFWILNDIFYYRICLKKLGLAELFGSFLIYEIDNMPRRYFASEKYYTKDEQKTTQENLYDVTNSFLIEIYTSFLHGKDDLTNLDGQTLF